MSSALPLVQPSGSNKPTVASGLPKYFPQIDGLRTLAILGVILFHLPTPGLMLGWSGVWLFYVISGFLITGILQDSKDRPRYFKNFYARRALRIFPIYFVGLLGLYGVARARGWATQDLWYYVVYCQNHLLGNSQFAPAFPPAYNHTWTLAVEEQFYLFWPLIVLVLSRQRLLAACLAMIVLAPLSRILLLHFTHNPFMALTPLVVNLDAFAVGGLVAAGLRSRRIMVWMVNEANQAKRACELIWLILSAVILCLVLLHDRHDYWNPLFWLAKIDANIFLTTLLSLWFALLILYVVAWDGWLRRRLSHRWLVHIGRISYGIYIFHGLVLTYAVEILNAFVPGWGGHKIAVVGINLLLPYLLARLSWHFLESPFLRLKRKFVSADQPNV